MSVLWLLLTQTEMYLWLVASGKLKGHRKKVKMALALIVPVQYCFISGGGRGRVPRLGSLNALGRSALPAGCISSLGFSQPQSLVAALFSEEAGRGEGWICGHFTGTCILCPFQYVAFESLWECTGAVLRRKIGFV